MADAFTGIDSLGLFLSGGASNYNPSDSLGGSISSKEIKGMSPVWITSIQGLVIEDAVYENGEGSATIIIDGSGNAIYTPPDGVAGSAVAIAEGERKVLTGDDTDKAIRIYRESDKDFFGQADFKLVNRLNGVISMSTITNAQRVSGVTTYRAIFVKAYTDIADILAWIETDGQATYSLAEETPDSNGDIQTISDEFTAPVGLAWVSAIADSSAIDLCDSPGISADETVGLWIRKVFPVAGVVDIKEQVNFFIQFVE